MDKIIDLNKLQKLNNKQKQRKSILLVDGQMPNFKGKDCYFSYSDDLGASDAAPYGLARISGFLDRHGKENKIIRLRDFASSAKKAELEKMIREADIIGISGLSNSAVEMFEFCLETKKKYLEKIIIGGREYFGLDYEWILKNQKKTGIDICCTSQGELVMLSMSLGVDKKEIGSIAYNEDEDGEIKKNEYFPRLSENAETEILHPQPAQKLPLEWYANTFLEFKKKFKHCGDTLVGSGCPYNCDFCANSRFLESRKYISSIEAAKKEIEVMAKSGIDFFFVRDLLLNARKENLDEFVEFMKKFNSDNEKEMKWIAFLSVKKQKNLKKMFAEMEKAGCIEVMVGVEDIVGDRAQLKKGANNETAAEFIDTAKEHMLVRAFLILGLPEHYKHSKEEIKESSLKFMKNHPQAIYRMGLWTPIVGTKDFEEYECALKENIRENPDFLKSHDTMHYVVDPKKMYDHLKIPEEKREINNANEWEALRDEIVKEYYESEEHNEFLKGLKGKSLLYEVAKEFQEITLNRLKNNETEKEFKIKMR